MYIIAKKYVDAYSRKIASRLEEVEEWIGNGATITQVAKTLKVPYTTFFENIKRHPELQEVVDGGKRQVVGKVENALLKRALGYDKVEEAEETKINGNVTETKYKKIVKHYPPDVGACIFFLCNRDPEKWQNKFENTKDTSKELLDKIKGFKIEVVDGSKKEGEEQ